MILSYTTEGMKLWREMELSMEAPKVHAVQDHLCDQLTQYQWIGDLMEDFVEQAHQDGIHDDRRTRSIKDKTIVAAIHSNWEHKRKLPSETMISEEVTRRSVQTQHSTAEDGEAIVVPISQKDEKRRIEGEKKDTVRAIALETIRGNIGPFFPTGHQQNLMDATRRMQIEPGQINKSL
jgi:hypothetical protein